MIRYKIDISQKECDALIEIQLKHSVSRGIQNFFRIVLAILAIALLYCTFFLRQTTESKILGIVSAAFFLWIATVGMIAYQKFLLKKVQNKLDKRATFGEREYGFDQDGVIVWTDFSYSELQWEAFKNWGIFKDYIYLTTIAEQRILVRKDELSEEDREELFDLLNANVKREEK